MKDGRYKIFITSDTHGNLPVLEALLPTINSCDYFVYLGDGNRDVDKLESRISVPTVRVAGNCDLRVDLPTETVLKMGEVNFFITHGNAYGVKSSKISLASRARELGCEFALYGHTYGAAVTDIGGVTLVNPGTLMRGSNKSYGIIIGDGNFFEAEITWL